MFGLKLIFQKKYDELNRNYTDTKDALSETSKQCRQKENHIKELEAKIEAQEKLIHEANRINESIAKDHECKVGPWCKNCGHSKKMEVEQEYCTSSWWPKFVNVSAGYYCMKHIKDICPEFESHKSKED